MDHYAVKSMKNTYFQRLAHHHPHSTEIWKHWDTHPHHNIVACHGARPHLKDGVLLLMLGGVAGGMLPGDLEASDLTVQPHQTRVVATVHLGHKPGLQPHTPWLTGHVHLRSGKPHHNRCEAGSMNTRGHMNN